MPYQRETERRTIRTTPDVPRSSHCISNTIACPGFEPLQIGITSPNDLELLERGAAARDSDNSYGYHVWEESLLDQVLD